LISSDSGLAIGPRGVRSSGVANIADTENVATTEGRYEAAGSIATHPDSADFNRIASKWKRKTRPRD